MDDIPPGNELIRAKLANAAVKRLKPGPSTIQFSRCHGRETNIANITIIEDTAPAAALHLSNLPSLNIPADTPNTSHDIANTIGNIIGTSSPESIVCTIVITTITINIIAINDITLLTLLQLVPRREYAIAAQPPINNPVPNVFIFVFLGSSKDFDVFFK